MVGVGFYNQIVMSVPLFSIPVIHSHLKFLFKWNFVYAPPSTVGLVCVCRYVYVIVLCSDGTMHHISEHRLSFKSIYAMHNMNVTSKRTIYVHGDDTCICVYGNCCYYDVPIDIITMAIIYVKHCITKKKHTLALIHPSYLDSVL